MVCICHRQATGGALSSPIVSRSVIKVRGHQVSPSELEAFLLTYPDVSDCCVVPVQDALSGEVRRRSLSKGKRLAHNTVDDDDDLRRRIQEYVTNNKADYKRLRGGIEFIDEIPRSPGGKILRRILVPKGLI